MFSEVNAQTTLSQGDVSIVGIDGNVNSGTAGFAFITYVDLAPGTVIKFTINDFNAGISSNASGNSNTNPNQGLYWTAGSGGLVKGTVVSILGSNFGSSSLLPNTGTITFGTVGFGSTGLSFNTSNLGRNVFAFQYAGSNDFNTSSSSAATFNGTILYGMCYGGLFGSSTWLTSGSVSNFKGYQPSDLGTANQLSGLPANTTYCAYSGPISGFATIAAARASVNNPSNWTTGTGTTGLATFPGNFTLPSSNTPPIFANSSPQTLTVCQGAGATSINSSLTVSDIDASQTETWSVTTSPTHGTLGGFNTTASSGSTSITPSGLTYAPTSGYSGTDNFVIQVSDGTVTASMTVNVTVNALPSIGISGGSTPICSGGAGTSLTGTGGTTYTWAPGIGLSATSGTTITANPGSNTTYTLTGSNGTCSNTATVIVTVNTTPPAITGNLIFPTGTNSPLYNTTGGGTWTSGSLSVATIGSSNGVANGLAAGTSLISYTVSGCRVTATVTVNTASSLIWYSVTGGGDASNLANWWSVNNNTGYQPTSFSTTATSWVFQSSMTSTAALSFTGNVSIISGGTFTPLTGSTTTVGGNWKNTSGNFNNNSGTVTFNGANGVGTDTISGSLTGANKFNNLNFNSPSANYTFLNNSADVGGNFQQLSGTVFAPSTNFNIGNNFSHTGGNFSPNGGTVTMTGGTATLTVTGMTTPVTNCFNNLSFNPVATSTYTVSSDLVLIGSFSSLTTFATLNLGSHTLTVGGSWDNNGPFTQGAGHQITYNGTSGAIHITGNQ